MSFEPLKARPKPTSPAQTSPPSTSGLGGLKYKPRPLKTLNGSESAQTELRATQILKATTPPPGTVLRFEGELLDGTQLKKAKAWYAANAGLYTSQVIKEIQKQLKVPATGKITDTFLKAVAEWQQQFPYYDKTGMWSSNDGKSYSATFAANGVITPDQLTQLLPAGLAAEKTQVTFIRTTEDLIRQWGQLKTVKSRTEAVRSLLAGLLKPLGVPMPSLSLQSMSSLGTFTSKTWDLALNEQNLSNPAASAEALRDLCDTIYHEARHAEQNAMIIRLLAGKGMTAGKIQTQTEMKLDVIQTLVKTPIAPGSAQAVIANQFYQARFGALKPQTRATYAALWDAEDALTAAKQRLAQLQQERQKCQTQMKTASGAARTTLQSQLNALMVQITAATAAKTAASNRYSDAYDAYQLIPGERDAFEVAGTMTTRRQALLKSKAGPK